LYIAHTGREAKAIAIKLAEQVRKAGISVKVDLTDASLKTQVKRAFRNSAEFLAIFGEEEVKTGNVSVRWLSREEGELQQRKVPYAEMVEFLRKIKNKGGSGSQ
jgi:histidyl-tRNA synthetase